MTDGLVLLVGPRADLPSPPAIVVAPDQDGSGTWLVWRFGPDGREIVDHDAPRSAAIAVAKDLVRDLAPIGFAISAVPIPELGRDPDRSFDGLRLIVDQILGRGGCEGSAA